jgi:hypothetical protein
MLKLESAGEANSNSNAIKLISARIAVVSPPSSTLPVKALVAFAMIQLVDAGPTGGDQRSDPNINDKFRKMVDELIVPLVQIIIIATIVLGFHVLVCRSIHAGAMSGALHQSGMHKARWHSLYALFVSTGSTYLLQNGGEPPNAILVIALIAICFLSTERFSFYYFRYHGRPSFDHGFIPLVSGGLISAFLHTINYIGCAPFAFWFSVLLGPLLSRAWQSANMSLLGAGRIGADQGSEAAGAEGTNAGDGNVDEGAGDTGSGDGPDADATATEDTGLFAVGDDNGSVDIGLGYDM